MLICAMVREVLNSYTPSHYIYTLFSKPETNSGKSPFPRISHLVIYQQKHTIRCDKKDKNKMKKEVLR